MTVTVGRTVAVVRVNRPRICGGSVLTRVLAVPVAVHIVHDPGWGERLVGRTRWSTQGSSEVDLTGAPQHYRVELPAWSQPGGVVGAAVSSRCCSGR
jgi:hypothetical protein